MFITKKTSWILENIFIASLALTRERLPNFSFFILLWEIRNLSARLRNYVVAFLCWNCPSLAFLIVGHLFWAVLFLVCFVIGSLYVDLSSGLYFGDQKIKFCYIKKKNTKKKKNKNTQEGEHCNGWKYMKFLSLANNNNNHYHHHHHKFASFLIDTRKIKEKIHNISWAMSKLWKVHGIM